MLISIASVSANELIDTQWDVNKEDNVLLMLTAFELIDTQWDVNFVVDVSDPVPV